MGLTLPPVIGRSESLEAGDVEGLAAGGPDGVAGLVGTAAKQSASILIYMAGMITFLGRGERSCGNSGVFKFC